MFALFCDCSWLLNFELSSIAVGAVSSHSVALRCTPSYPVVPVALRRPRRAPSYPVGLRRALSHPSYPVAAIGCCRAPSYPVELRRDISFSVVVIQTSHRFYNNIQIFVHETEAENTQLNKPVKSWYATNLTTVITPAQTSRLYCRRVDAAGLSRA